MNEQIKQTIRLVVGDDSSKIRGTIINNLKLYGYSRIEMLPDSKNLAMELLDKYNPHVLLLDNHVLGSNKGPEFCRELRTLYDYDDGIIGMSLNSDKNEIYKWIAAGVDGFLEQPKIAMQNPCHFDLMVQAVYDKIYGRKN